MKGSLIGFGGRKEDLNQNICRVIHQRHAPYNVFPVHDMKNYFQMCVCCELASFKLCFWMKESLICVRPSKEEQNVEGISLTPVQAILLANFEKKTDFQKYRDKIDNQRVYL